MALHDSTLRSEDGCRNSFRSPNWLSSVTIVSVRALTKATFASTATAVLILVPLANAALPRSDVVTEAPSSDRPATHQVQAASCNFYVAPDGTASGNGSQPAPWDLQTALNHPAAVGPGAMLCLRAGTYAGRFTSRLTGSADGPIIVRSYPGEWARIDGNKQVTLLDALAVDDRTIRLSEDALLGAGQVVRIGDEHIYLDGKQGDLFINSVRGWNGTRVAAHDAGSDAYVLGNTIEALGAYTWFWGFEITNSNPDRVSLKEDRGAGLNLLGRGHRAINLVIHDTGHPGIGFWDQVGDGGEIYGCLVWACGTYDNGGSWTRGSGVYAQNTSGRRFIRDSIWFRNFTNGINVFATNGHTVGFRIEGNIVFENPTSSIFAGTESNSLEDLEIRDNATYYRPTNNSWSTIVGYTSPPNRNVTIAGNYFVSRNVALTTKNFRQVTVVSNTLVSTLRAYHLEDQASGTYLVDYNHIFSPAGQPLTVQPAQGPAQIYGFQRWQTELGFDKHGTFAARLPDQTVVIVRPNAYESGRGHIAVYNWAKLPVVNVDLAGILNVGDRFEIRDVQNYFGRPVLAGSYSGGTVGLPMQLTETAPPVGKVTQVDFTHTAPEFAVFVVSNGLGATARCCSYLPALHRSAVRDASRSRAEMQPSPPTLNPRSGTTAQ